MTTSEKIQYYLLLGVAYLIAATPFAILYLLSDLLAGLLHSVLRYRRRVVRGNLESSFPEKSEKELRAIERRFYRFLTDYGFETMKMLTMSPKKMKRHLDVTNAELVDEATDAGQSVTLLLGHYCNWEWVSSLPIYFDGSGIPAQVYHYLHSRAMDRIFYRIRTHFGSHNIEMRDIMKQLILWKREGKPSVTGFIADQAPGFDTHLFMDFLNHDTGVYTGPERIARFLDSRVLYCHLSRPKRGRYRLTFVPVCMNPKELPVFEISRRYFTMLEENIREAPQYWLWSHRRWKRTREMFMEHWGDQAERILSRL